MHRCYVCDPANPCHAFTIGPTSIAARVPARFAGPPGSANGGIATGMLACPASAATARDTASHVVVIRIAARIRASVPLDEPLVVDVSAVDGAYAVAIAAGDRPLVSGTVETVSLADVPVPGHELAPAPLDREADIRELARVDVPDRPPFFEETGEHPIRGCFSCGPDNSAGLQIYPRVVSDGIVCAPWRPSTEFDDGNGAVSPMIVTAALDCSSGICMPVSMQRDLLAEDQFFLLGSLDVRYLRLPPIDRGYRIAAKALLRDGRKFFGLSAMFDDAGTPYALAESTWIIASMSRTAAFGART